MMTCLPVAVSPASALAMISATTDCTATPLVASNTRLTKRGLELSDCEYVDCENLMVIGTVCGSNKTMFYLLLSLLLLLIILML